LDLSSTATSVVVSRLLLMQGPRFTRHPYARHRRRHDKAQV